MEEQGYENNNGTVSGEQQSMEKQYSRGEAYQDTLDYYRYLGMDHYEADGRHWFMVVLKR